MAKDLVIVESPAKARTVGRFLGNKYVAKASMGHVRDLPRGKMGVKVDDGGFDPTYQNLPDKRKVIAELAKASKEARTVYLATDPDREGEAISWHLIKAAKINQSKTKRVVFHEITDHAIKEAFAHPRELNQDLVDAQQTRRILDRLVGYRLSPVLWGKVRRGLSAGRVQSVALRLVVDREGEIHGFVPKEYWTISANLVKQSNNELEVTPFKAGLHSIKGQRGQVQIPNEIRAKAMMSDLDGADYHVGAIRKRETKRRPVAPFITSTLQQEAWRKLRFSAKRTMQVAQQLYEGLSIGAEGSIGLITYMRTDSTNVSATALHEVRSYIVKSFGPEYAPKSPRLYKKKAKGAQEAHEAIRPTSIEKEPKALRSYLNGDQFRLYDLVWKRMLASQMADALFDSTNVQIETTRHDSRTIYVFSVSGSVLKFPGFRVVYTEDVDDASENNASGSAHLPILATNEPLQCLDLTSDQHFTQPPPSYTEATLIKAMEEQGIGRPSTYAPIISTIMDRDYVRKDRGKFVPTKLGTAVTGLLTDHFPDIMDVGFTASIEERLDDIATGEREWVPMLREFYGPFDKAIERAMKQAQRVPRAEIDEETDEFCEKCERPMVIKSGRFGRFISCSGFPECRNSKPFLHRVGVECPQCGNDLVERRQKGRGGKRFYGCSAYPTCAFAVNQRPLQQPCPECGKLLVTSGRAGAKCTLCQYKGAVPESEPIEAAK